MSDKTPSKKSAKPPRDYGKALDGLHQLESMLVDNRSPMVAELKKYMAPYDAAVKSGQITKQDYMNIGGQFAQDWASKHLFNGEGLPTDEDVKGPMLQLEMQRRQQAMASDSRPEFAAQGAAMAASPTPQDAQNPYGPLARQAGALSLLASLVKAPQPPATPPTQPQSAPAAMPAQPPSAKLAQAIKANAQGVKVPTVATDDAGKLGEAQLLMLQQLARSPRQAPLDESLPGYMPPSY